MASTVGPDRSSPPTGTFCQTERSGKSAVSIRNIRVREGDVAMAPDRRCKETTSPSFSTRYIPVTLTRLPTSAQRGRCGATGPMSLGSLLQARARARMRTQLAISLPRPASAGRPPAASARCKARNFPPLSFITRRIF